MNKPIETTPKRKRGRPSIFTNEKALEICKRISAGESLRTICEDSHMPNRDTVFEWLLDGKHKIFSDQYDAARAKQAECMFEDLLHIADDGTNDWMTRTLRNGEEIEVVNPEVVQRSRLRVDTRKWYLSKVLPKKFGDSSSKDINVNINIASKIQEARKRVDPSNRIFN